MNLINHVMEKYFLENDIPLLYVEAESFPEGILQAFDKLHALLPAANGRKLFGISRPGKKGTVIYKAAAEQRFDGEEKQLGCEVMVLKKGTYRSITIENFMDNIPGIGKAFEQLISAPDVAPDGYCVEMYLNDKDVRCMVRLASKNEQYNSSRLKAEVIEAFHEFKDTLDLLEEENLNKRPFEGSWTAGQVAEHIVKSISGVPELFNGPTETTERQPDAKVESLKQLFLNFNIKMESPKSIVPVQSHHNKKELLNSIEHFETQITDAVRTMDLRVLCKSYEFPGEGFLTRLEWINFIVVHIQRHTQQLNNIYRILKK